MVFKGNFYKSECNGPGVRAWMADCKIWELNFHPLGAIRQVFGGRPFIYIGEFLNEFPCGEGTAIFKDGTRWSGLWSGEAGKGKPLLDPGQGHTFRNGETWRNAGTEVNSNLVMVPPPGKAPKRRAPGAASTP